MRTRHWPLVAGILLVGLAVYGGMRLIGHSPVGDEAAANAMADADTRSLVEQRPELLFDIQKLYAGNPDTAAELIRQHGHLAPSAFGALGQVGLDLLPLSDEMPNYVFYIESPVSREAAFGVGPIADYLQALAFKDPKKADTLFHVLTRLGTREAALLRHYPQALPILAVSPARAADVIERYGDAAVSLMLRFTPDSYPEIARLLSTDGARVFAVRDALMKAQTDNSIAISAGSANSATGARQDILENFIAMYFLQYGDISAWLERRVGLEQTTFFMAANLPYMDQVKSRDGEPALRAALLSLTGYARSSDADSRRVADIAMKLPGGLPLFVECSNVAAMRDQFFLNYAERGGAALITHYDRQLWPDLVKAAGEYGDSVMVPLATLIDLPKLHETLKKVANSAVGHTVIELLGAVSKAMVDDGGPTARTFRLVLRTLQQASDGNWNDIPDDYLSRQYSWIWDVLPGRDAFRLARLVLHGYSPTLFEAASGVWDAANVITFAYSAGGALVDCTKSVSAALGTQSWSALAQALGVVAKDAAGNVLARLVDAVSQPRNYIRLAVTAGYFAYDTFLTYAPMEIPMRARLLEINQKYLTTTMRGMLMDVIKDVGIQALILRPEFDHRGLQLSVPTPADPAALSRADRIALELARLDANVKNAFIQLLDESERRRNFMKMLGLAKEQLPGFGDDDNSGNPLGPGAPVRPKEYDPLDPNNEGEDMSGGPRESEPISSDAEPIAWAVNDNGERIALHSPRFRNVTAEAHVSPITGRRVDVPADVAGWEKMVHNDPSFIAFCLEQIANLATPRR